MTSRRRVAVVAGVTALIAVLLFSRGAYLALLRMLSAAQSVATDHPALAAVLVVAFAALAAMLAFVSTWVIVPFAVFTWGTGRALLLIWGGWLLGGMTSYAIGRFLGRPAVRWLAHSSLLTRYENRITPRSAFGLVLLLQFGLPSEIPGYLLGLVRYSFPWYVVSLSLAELLHGIATIYLGSQLLQRRAAPLAAVGAMLVLVTLGAAWGLRRRLAAPDGTADDPPSGSDPPTPVVVHA